MQRVRQWRFLPFLLIAGLAGTTISASAATLTKSSSAISVVDVSARVAHTAKGNVGYRIYGHGPPLVLIMGYAGTMQTWDPEFVDMLARHFRVITFDNAGIGKTAMLRSPLSIDEMADQTSAFITSLHLGMTNVLGWSMGGMIAQSLAVRHPAQVQRLVLCATFPGTGIAVVPSKKDIAALTGNDLAAAQADLFPPDQKIAAQAFSASTSAFAASSSASAKVIAAQANAALAWFKGHDPAGRLAGRIAVHTLVADGAHDRLVALANDRNLAVLIPSSRLVIYPDAGHAFMFQEGASFTHLVQTFLSGAPMRLIEPQIRQHFLVDSKAWTAAGAKWISGLKSLNSASTATQLARIDLAYADAIGKFDDQLLDFGASGTLGQLVMTFVSADEPLAKDILALAAQNKSTTKTWTATITKDGKVGFSRDNALRRQLGLRPLTVPTTTTTLQTTPTF